MQTPPSPLGNAMETGYQITLTPNERKAVIARIVKSTTFVELQAVKATLTDNEKADIGIQCQLLGQLRIVNRKEENAQWERQRTLNGMTIN